MPGSRACEVGCTCGRHPGGKRAKPRAVRKRVPKETCKAQPYDGCTNLAKHSDGYCEKHHQRMYRNGTIVPQKVYIKNKGEICKTFRCINMAHCKGYCAKCYERRKHTPKIKPIKVGARLAAKHGYRCVCGHIIDEHQKAEHECKRSGCNCTEMQGANNELFENVSEQLLALKFMTLLNDTALCTQCLARVTIGHWIDPEVLARAAHHRRRTCPALRGISKVNRSPNRAERTRLVS